MLVEMQDGQEQKTCLPAVWHGRNAAKRQPQRHSGKADSIMPYAIGTRNMAEVSKANRGQAHNSATLAPPT